MFGSNVSSAIESQTHERFHAGTVSLDVVMRGFRLRTGLTVGFSRRTQSLLAGFWKTFFAAENLDSRFNETLPSIENHEL
jgi:hypothetical protein